MPLIISAPASGLGPLQILVKSGKIRHEVSVHHVHVDPIRPGLLRLDHLLAQTGEVSGEN